MRRQDREITDRAEILDIIRRCRVCHVAFHGGEYPYVVPLNFGIEQRGDRLFLYFHGATEGKKIELLRRDPRVAFVMETIQGSAAAEGNIACRCSMFYESVMGEGTISLLTEEEKPAAFRHLMRHYYGEEADEFSFETSTLARTVAMQLAVSRLSAKRHLPHRSTHSRSVVDSPLQAPPSP